MRRALLPLLALLAGCSDARLDQVRAQFKDPGSVQFKDVQTFSWSDTASEGTAICGQLNAKNSYGAFTGFAAFIASGHDLRVTLAKDAAEAAKVRRCCAEIERASQRGVSPAFVTAATQACASLAHL